MDNAEPLLDKILEYVCAQKECAEKFKTLAKELEDLHDCATFCKITGSAASVGGSTVMVAAGIATFCTGGAALPLVAAAGTVGGVVSGLGSVTSVGTEIVAAELSNSKTTEAERAAEKIQNLEDEIHKLVNSLIEEGERKEHQTAAAAACREVPQEDYVMQKIMRAIANREGLFINKNIDMQMVVIDLSKMKTSRTVQLGKSIGLYTFLGTLVTKKVAKSVAKTIPQFVTSVGKKAAAKAVGNIGGGAFGLLLSIPELIENVKETSKVSDATEKLRKNAGELLAASKELEKNLDEIKNALQRLANIRDFIEKRKRSSDVQKTFIDFAIEKCQNERARQWLEDNSELSDFVQLVDMFHFINKHIDEKDKENHINDIDITFIAHGSISDPMIPACCLLPLPTISDVLLYSPWNCYLSADAAYAVATGRMKPQHRVFHSIDPNKDHRPDDLPDEWNSMKKAAEEGTEVPNIFLSPFEQTGDGAWERFELLEKIYGPPDRNRIIIPFILPENSGVKGKIPFSIVTLAMSLVLMFSRFQATIHLTTCLGDLLAGEKLDKESLSEQYAWADDSSYMTCSPEAFNNSDLWKRLKRFYLLDQQC